MSTVIATGRFSFNAAENVCNLEGSLLDSFVRGVEASLQFVCGNNCKAIVAHVCSHSVRQSLPSRRLQVTSRLIEFDIIVQPVFDSGSCYIANVNKVTETISKNIQNGQLAAALSNNADISSVLDKTILDCLTVWGGASAASAFEGISPFSGLIQIDCSGAPLAINITVDKYYPVS